MDMNARLHGRLIDAARTLSTISYKALGEYLGLDMSKPDDRIRIGEMLDEVNVLEHKAGRPMLSAVVVHQKEGLPGGGFFNCARELGRLPSRKRLDELEYFVSELRRVQSFWSGMDSDNDVAKKG